MPLVCLPSHGWTKPTSHVSERVGWGHVGMPPPVAARDGVARRDSPPPVDEQDLDLGVRFGSRQLVRRGSLRDASSWLEDKVVGPILSTHPGRVLLAGGIAGIVSRTIVAPLERTKILLQVQGLSVSPVGQPLRYTSVIQSLGAIQRKEGIQGWFRGNTANCIRIFPMSAIQFYAFDVLKGMIYSYEGTESLTPLQRLGAGALAGAVAQTATYPLDFMRARLTVDTRGKYGGVFSGMGVVMREEGVRALYRGLVPSLLGIMPYVGVDFMIYGTLREMLPRNPATGEPEVVGRLVVGAIAGAAGQTVAYPLDTVR